MLKIYNELTFGYQKDWARYVYSAKKTETREKRLAEMETVLAEGFIPPDLLAPDTVVSASVVPPEDTSSIPEFEG